MYTIKAEVRDLEVKAKRLRKIGLVPCSISDGLTHETMFIQIPEGEVRKLLREKSLGGKVRLDCGEKQFDTIIREVAVMPLKDQIESITFQLLNEHEFVSSFAKVKLTNQEKIQTMIYLMVKEIPYKALPKDLVEQVEVDVTKLKPGTSLLLRDMPIWQNENLQMILAEDRAIVNLAYK